MTNPATSGDRARAAFWLAAAFAGLFSVLVLNGRPLFYFDTVGYVSQGSAALVQLGLSEAPQTGSTGRKSPKAEGAVKTVDGSRSPFYSLLAGIFDRLGMLEALLIVNVAALVLSVTLLARQIVSRHLTGVNWVTVAALPLVVACFGALPFFAAYLMPDLLTSVMILTFATLAIFGPGMRRAELVLAYGAGSFAIISHLSHFPIGGLIFLGALPLAWLTGQRRWWLGPMVIALVLVTAYAQQKTFRVMSRAVAHSEVTIRPFLTARLIQDGPGYDYLAAHCPDVAIDTCPLWTALQRSDDPYRLTASHITFETSAKLGSFLLMTPDEQKAVADAQVSFFKAVLIESPGGVLAAFVRNSLHQAGMFSVNMTLPTEKIAMRNTGVTGALSGPLAPGRVRYDGTWLNGLTEAQGTLYAASLGFGVMLMLLPGALPGNIRLLALMILGGVLANALVCGGISQPATRYGARVIWLLPHLAVLLALVAQRGGPGTAR